MQVSCLLAASLAFLMILYRRDLSRRVQAEDALRQQEGRLRLLVEQMPALLWTLDEDERVTSCQGKGMVDVNLQVGHYLEESAAGVFVPEDAVFPPVGPCRQALGGMVFTGQVAVAERTYELHVKPLRNPAGAVTGCIGVALDVTARTRAEETLSRKQALLRGLLDSIPDLIFYKDTDGSYLGCNKAFELYVGRDEEALCGLTNDKLFPDDAPSLGAEGERRAPGEGRPGRSEACLRYADGHSVLAEVLETPYYGPDGKILGLIGLSRDITERRHLEEQVHQAGKMEALGQLAGGIAHDFNNLLTAILGNLSLIPQNLPDGHPARNLAKTAELAAFRAADLTHQLLGFSRKTPLQPRPANLNVTLAEVVAILGHTLDPRITLEVQADPKLWTVKADPGQLSQVLMNLCLNARDAMSDGGRLVVETANLILTPDYTRLNYQARPGEFVRLEVRDSGIGMTPEVRARIFEPFFTTKGKGKGTGLGLAMVFGIVQQHRGWVECHSEPGCGTTFTVYLPRLDTPVDSPSASDASAPKPGRETLLIADDEESIRSLGRAILERYGYQVLLAADGKEAVEVYRREQARIDLVLLDLRMPRLSGHDAFQQMLQINPNVSVVVVSGYSDQYLTESDHHRIRGFLAKPFVPDELARVVRTALDHSNGK
jgi:PAS domain S-box-containing protein